MKKLLIGLALLFLFSLFIGGGLFFFVNSKAAECRKGSGEEALAACTLFISYSPHDMLRAYFLGERSRHYEALGDKKSALEDLKTVISFHEKGSFTLKPPLLMKIYGKLALVSGELGNEAEAVKYANEAVKLGAADPAIYLSLGGLNIREKRYKESFAYLEKAQRLGADSVDVNFYLGLAQAGLGDYDKAYDFMKAAEPGLYSQVLAGKRPQTERGRFDKTMGFICAEKKQYAESERYLMNAISSGYPCPECEPALMQLKEAVKAEKEAEEKAKNAPKKKRKNR